MFTDLGYKPRVVERAQFEWSPLFMALNIKTKNKTDKSNKVINTDKQDKNSQHIFLKFEDISDFKELSRDSMDKKLNDFYKKFTRLKNVSPQTKNNENLKECFVLYLQRMI